MSRDTLTYFTKKHVIPGSIVTVPLRSKQAYGLVVNSKSVEENKSEIKSLSYSIKKIDSVESHSFLSTSFIESVSKIADYYATTVGAVLSVLLPKSILESSSDLTYTPRKKKTDSFHETLLVQCDNEERFALYKSLIREEFAKGNSVYFCVPTQEDISSSRKILEKGIESFTYTLHGKIVPKTLIDMWKKITKETHPILIIGTGSFLSIPRDDIGTIIVEKESSRGYTTISRPFLDIRKVARIITKVSNQKLILGDSLLRIETLHEEKSGDSVPLSPLKFRSLSSAECRLVDMRTPKDHDKREFKIISDEMKEMISRGEKNNELTFVFCSRKGLAPSTVCSDCGTVVTCDVCSSPVVLHAKNGHNVYMCHQCGRSREADVLCTVCKGWRLTTLGIGIDRVVQELSILFPTRKIFIMDKEHITTHLRAVKTRDTFFDSPTSILVGTEMAISYLNQKVQNVAIVSMDSFFSIPDYKIHEKIFHILLDLRTIAEKKFIVQTRQEHVEIFDDALKGNLFDFYRREIEEREELQFPPFTTSIKLSLTGEKKAVRNEMEKLVDFLKPQTVSVFESFITGKEYTAHGLIMLPCKVWVEPELLTKLRSLPPSVTIKIDPDTLL